MTDHSKSSSSRPTFEIRDIRDPKSFMRFIIENAPNDSIWFLSIHSAETAETVRTLLSKAVRSHRTILGLANVPSKVQLPINSSTRDILVTLIDRLNPSFDLLETTVISGETTFLEVYDNLTCCWVSRDMSLAILQHTSDTLGFRIIS